MVLVLQDGPQIGANVSVVIDNQHGRGILVDDALAGRSVNGMLDGHGINLLRGHVGFAAAHLDIQHLVDELRQVMCVASDDREQVAGFLAGMLQVRGLGELGKRPLDERQRRAQVVAHLGVEVQLLTFHEHALVLNARPLQVIHIDANQQGQQQENCGKRHKCQGSLATQLVKILTGLFMQLFEVVRLSHDFFALHQQHASIFLGDKCRHQLRLLLVGFPLEDVNSQLQQLVAVGGIDVGRIQQRVHYLSDAAVLAWQAINAAEQRQCFTSLLKGLARSHCRAVIHAEHQVNFFPFVLANPLLDGVVGRRFGPVTLQGGNHLDTGMLGNSLPETVMALDGGRRALEAHHLDNSATFIQSSGDILSHQVPHLIVVGTHIGSVFLGVGLALKYDDRDALIIGPIDGWRNRRYLVGGHNQQVNPSLDKAVNLLDLPLVAIVGHGKAQVHIIMKIGTDL